ncbi:MAG: TRAP transporter small permease subunit, partial [Roseinatronobacter sp.]
NARHKAGLDLITAVLFFLFAGVLLWQGWSLASDSIARWERTRSAWNPPVWPVKSAIPVAAALLLLQGLVRVWADIRILQNKPVDPEIFGAPAEPREVADGH